MDPHNHQHGVSWQRITDALETRGYGPRQGTGNPEQWNRYLCPVHEGDGKHHTPSLGVRYDPRQSKTIVRCFARCDDEAVLDRIGLRVRDMFDRLPERTNRATPAAASRRTRGGRPAGPAPTSTPRARAAGAGRRPEVPSPVERAILAAHFPVLNKPDLGVATGRGEIVDSYVYRWPDGRVEGAVHRVHTPHERGHAKSFFQTRWTGTEWERSGFAPIPWRLSEIREALDTGREIYVCEGEKDVQRAIQAGQIATCNAMGAGSWTEQHARWLRGAARVIVVADRDRPGYRHAAKVADTLTGRVGEVRVLQARSGKDLTDHFDAGYDLTDLDPVPYLDRPQHQNQQRQQWLRPPPTNRGHDRTRSR